MGVPGHASPKPQAIVSQQQVLLMPGQRPRSQAVEGFLGSHRILSYIGGFGSGKSLPWRAADLLGRDDGLQPELPIFVRLCRPLIWPWSNGTEYSFRPAEPSNDQLPTGPDDLLPIS